MNIHPKHHARRRARAAARRKAQTPTIRLDEAFRNIMNALFPPPRINCSPEIAAQFSNFGMTREATDIRLSQALALEAGAVPNELVNLIVRTSTTGRVTADDLDRLKGWGGADR